MTHVMEEADIYKFLTEVEGSRRRSRAYLEACRRAGPAHGQEDDSATVTTDSHADDATSANGQSVPDVGSASASSVEAPAPLLCDLVSIGACDARFRAHEQEEWIDHVLSHMGGTYPDNGVCWFCWEQFPRDRADGDHPAAHFVRRLRHLATHLLDPGQRELVIRPDFHFVEHAVRHHMVGRDVLDAARSYNEVPLPRGITFTLPPERHRRGARSEAGVLVIESRRRGVGDGRRVAEYQFHRRRH
ncbi:hypothetical protein GMORB2_2055 [Geosmithia morbida]|uniref:Uncharacterized protein n=1 Tax=Geosmithia morbida TaxID=1094350 RepID=A0A9P4YSD7_9HYPO|nr:uncharacterized protein GMORB2_2055 [Geosmithia morbida]KAF4121647.1 hypothetical protein GMORB2_2055 [Geosmithia morbida]